LRLRPNLEEIIYGIPPQIHPTHLLTGAIFLLGAKSSSQAL
jgi:hypothetical protein